MHARLYIYKYDPTLYIDPLDQPCDDEHLLKIAATVCFHWKVIGRRLVGVKTVQDIDREAEQCEQEKRDQMF